MGRLSRKAPRLARTFVYDDNGEKAQITQYVPSSKDNLRALTYSRILNNKAADPIPGVVVDRSKPTPYVQLVIHVEDARDNVLLAIIRALLLGGNVPCFPSEIAAMVVHWGIATTGLGGYTPHATVSSRISNHFKRSAASVPPRRPLLGIWSQEGNRQVRYFVDREDIPVGVLTAERIAAKPKSGLPPPRCRQKPAKDAGTVWASARNVVRQNEDEESDGDTEAGSMPPSRADTEPDFDSLPPSRKDTHARVEKSMDVEMGAMALLALPTRTMPRPDSAVELFEEGPGQLEAISKLNVMPEPPSFFWSDS